MSKPEITLCWLEDASSWTAAGAHLRGTIKRLAVIDREPQKVIAWSTSIPRLPSRIDRASRLSKLIAQSIWAAITGTDDETLIARWHPLITPVVLAWRLRGKRVFLLVQGRFEDIYDSHAWLKYVPWLRNLAEAGLRSAHGFAVPTAGLQRDLARVVGISECEIAILPNGVDTEIYGSTPSSTTAPDPTLKPYAVFMGNMAGWQGVDTILEAKSLDAWPSDLNLVFIGDGAKRHLVEKSVDPAVHWLGTMTREAAVPWLQEAVVGLAPKKSVPATEAGIAPFKIVEYAAAGLPVVASRVTGQDTIVETLGNGLLVRPDSAQDLAAAVHQIFCNSELRDALARLGQVNAPLFDWVIAGDRLADALQEAEHSS